MIETLEQANATEDPARREELLTYVFVGGGYSGLEALAELQDFAADAMDRYPRARLHGMRWILVEAMDRVLPEVPADLAEYALRELRGRGIDIRLGTRLEEASADSRRALDRRADPTRTLVWTAGVAPHPSLASLALPLDEQRQGPRRRVHARRGAAAASGRSATAPRCPTRSRTARPRARRPRSTPSARGRRSPTTSPAELGVATKPRRFGYRAKASFVNLGRYKAVGKLGRPTFRGFPAWWMARSYHMSQIPGTARKIRAVVDWTVGLPFRRDVAEVGSIGHPRPLRDEVYARGGSHRPVD